MNIPLYGDGMLWDTISIDVKHLLTMLHYTRAINKLHIIYQDLL